MYTYYNYDVRKRILLSRTYKALLRYYLSLFTSSFLIIITDGIPNDGLPIEDIVTVHIGLTVVYVTLATTGLVFAVVCLVFNRCFRQRTLES